MEEGGADAKVWYGAFFGVECGLGQGSTGSGRRYLLVGVDIGRVLEFLCVRFVCAVCLKFVLRVC